MSTENSKDKVILVRCAIFRPATAVSRFMHSPPCGQPNLSILVRGLILQVAHLLVTLNEVRKFVAFFRKLWRASAIDPYPIRDETPIAMLRSSAMFQPLSSERGALSSTFDHSYKTFSDIAACFSKRAVNASIVSVANACAILT